MPPPSPYHRRSPILRTVTQDDEDMVAETTDSTVVIRITPRTHGEEILTVEMPEEGEESKAETTEPEEKKED